MPWDQSRPVPWKRLLMFEGIYVGIFAAIILVAQRKNISSAGGSIAFAVGVTTVVLYALIKLGYYPSWLRSRRELAEIRAEKLAARQFERASRPAKPGRGRSGKAAPVATREPVRERPATTRRTATGPNNRPRRVRDTRKR